MDKPVLFIKTGIEASEPFGFYTALAQEYNADIHSITILRTLLSNGTLDFSQRMGQRVRQEVQIRTQASLNARRDVVFDGFLNTYKRREELRQLAQRAGGLVVSISMRTPLPIAEERLMERYEKDLLDIPKAVMPLGDRLNNLFDMARRLEDDNWPHQSGRNESSVVLDGEADETWLLAQVAIHLDEVRLADELSPYSSN